MTNRSSNSCRVNRNPQKSCQLVLNSMAHRRNTTLTQQVWKINYKQALAKHPRPSKIMVFLNRVGKPNRKNHSKSLKLKSLSSILRHQARSTLSQWWCNNCKRMIWSLWPLNRYLNPFSNLNQGRTLMRNQGFSNRKFTIHIKKLTSPWYATLALKHTLSSCNLNLKLTENKGNRLTLTKAALEWLRRVLPMVEIRLRNLKFQISHLSNKKMLQKPSGPLAAVQVRSTQIQQWSVPQAVLAMKRQKLCRWTVVVMPHPKTCITQESVRSLIIKRRWLKRINIPRGGWGMKEVNARGVALSIEFRELGQTQFLTKPATVTQPWNTGWASSDRALLGTTFYSVQVLRALTVANL